ncbi:MAG: uroporphyrinogen decarboxylase family protein [Kiritimatiellae bacterium]|nr:uroporphyrinogen decarboxylase family protein [Verrucomicrobiota bacterium]MCG2678937.1 uroporphyrinogen decarboxylase family protein [Kiritimatiellia bacterium]
MTSRERVLQALRHEEPDRVPIAMTSSGFTRDEPDGTDAFQDASMSTPYGESASLCRAR